MPDPKKLAPADRKAHLAKAMAGAATAEPVVTPVPDTGVVVYGFGEVAIVAPALLPHTPPHLVELFNDRMRANATGCCPRCPSGAVSIPGGPERAQAGTFTHDPDCPVLVGGDVLRRYVDPRGLKLLGGAA